MDRIATTFEAARREGRKVLVGYLTAGDPDFAGSLADVQAALGAGLDIVELGVPFSDPTADGPVIQEAAQRALAGGMTFARVLDLVRAVRAGSQAPIVLFGYANPFFRRGWGRALAEAAAAGADALLVVDLPFEESAEVRALAQAAGLCLIPSIAPTTPPARAAAILREARGFVYYIMVTGVTGARADVAADVAEHVAALRACTALPVAVGFGVGSGAQARAAGVHADAVVVGSALVRAAREGRLAALARELAGAMRGAG